MSQTQTAALIITGVSLYVVNQSDDSQTQALFSGIGHAAAGWLVASLGSQSAWAAGTPSKFPHTIQDRRRDNLADNIPGLIDMA